MEPTKLTLYPCPNQRKCYWLLRDCLKGRQGCSTRCPDYLSVAQERRIRRAKDPNLKV